MSWDAGTAGGGAWDGDSPNVLDGDSQANQIDHGAQERASGCLHQGCFNYGESGYMKAECTNEAVAREFTGQCRLCQEQGHRASECPSKPPSFCKNCKQEGHEAITCENPRKIDRSGIDDVPGEVAWEQLRAAVADHDLDDVKEAAARYIKANPDATYVTLEKAFRSQNLSIYLIALEKELTSTLTNMDFQGNLDKKYTIQWRWSAKSARPKEAEGWPSPEENMERLGDAGEPVDRGIPRCTNCSQLGHSRARCDQDKNENERATVKCYHCDSVGHRMRDCPNPREEKSVSLCRNCGQPGHRKDDCTNEKVVQCRNCDVWGHSSRECKEPKDWARFKCSLCEEVGHTKVRCPQANGLPSSSMPRGDGGEGDGGEDFAAAAVDGGEGWRDAPVQSGW